MKINEQIYDKAIKINVPNAALNNMKFKKPQIIKKTINIREFNEVVLKKLAESWEKEELERKKKQRLYTKKNGGNDYFEVDYYDDEDNKNITSDEYYKLF